jgi:DNA-binding winged helix-turn-helix (wHTH) protein/TolB-like protein/Flp pilus assembly protein TadD
MMRFPADGPAAAYEFGPCVLDVARYELRRGGRRVRLERQPLDLLILLVERRGQLVSHEEIAARLWGEGAFVEVATGIHSAVLKIRRALRDDAEAPRFVESVARRGYRFVAPVRVVAHAEQAPAREVAPLADAGPDRPTAAPPREDGPRPELAGSEAPPVPPPADLRRGRTRWLAVALAALAAGAAWYRLAPREEPGRIRLAVLPFENVSGEKELDYLLHGIVAESVALLGQADPDRLSVVGRSSTRRFAGSDRPVGEIGADLGADYLVEGALRADRRQLRLTVNLIRVRGEVQEWATSFDRERGEILGLERELANALAGQIRLRLSPARSAALDRGQTRSPAAYDQYLRGLYLADLAIPAAVMQATEAFEAAVAADPEYAHAWAGIARIFSARPINSDFPPLEAWPRARAAAARAVEIRPDLAEAQVAMGRLGVFAGDRLTAESALRRALEIDPDHAEAHLMLGHLLSQQGRHAEALAAAARARSLDPLSPMNHALSSLFAFQARDFPVALDLALRALELAPGFWIAHLQKAQALEQLGRSEEALAALAEATRLSGVNSKPVALTGYILARSGRTGAAREVLAELHETARSRFVPPCALALVHAGLGEREAVFEWLEKALEVRDVHLVFLPVDAKWDPWREDPRFRSLLARAGVRAAGVALP